MPTAAATTTRRPRGAIMCLSSRSSTSSSSSTLSSSLSSSSLWLLLLCVLIFISSVGQVSAGSVSRNGRKLSRSHFQFSVDLYRHLAQDHVGRNVVFSPYTVDAVLSMLFLGTSSSSNSSRLLRQSLHFDNISYVEVHKSFKEIAKNFEDNYYKTILQFTNGVFYQVICVPLHVNAGVDEDSIGSLTKLVEI